MRMRLLPPKSKAPLRMLMRLVHVGVCTTPERVNPLMLLLLVYVPTVIPTAHPKRVSSW